MKKIMMVDDEPDQIFTAKIGLELDGKYEFIGANSGEHCFELLNERRADSRCYTFGSYDARDERLDSS